MNEQEVSVRIPLCWAGCAALWIAGFTLLVWSTVDSLDPSVGQWALYLSAAAAAWTVINVRKLERRRIVRAVQRAWQEEQLDRLDYVGR